MPHFAVAWEGERHSHGAVQVTVGTGVGVAVVLATIRFGVEVRPGPETAAADTILLLITSVTSSTPTMRTREWQRTGRYFEIMVSLLIFSGEGKVDKNCEICPLSSLLHYKDAML